MNSISNQSGRRHVLIVSYHFPPRTGGGVFRSLKFAKYLPEFGWKPIVLCVQPTEDDIQDPTLLEELTNDIIVKRVKHIHPVQIKKSLLLIRIGLSKFRLRKLARNIEPHKLLRWIPPDPLITWNRPAYRCALKLVHQYSPSVIFVTSPPHSSQLLGIRIETRHGFTLNCGFPRSLDPKSIHILAYSLA